MSDAQGKAASEEAINMLSEELKQFFLAALCPVCNAQVGEPCRYTQQPGAFHAARGGES